LLGAPTAYLEIVGGGRSFGGDFPQVQMRARFLGARFERYFASGRHGRSKTPSIPGLVLVERLSFGTADLGTPRGTTGENDLERGSDSPQYQNEARSRSESARLQPHALKSWSVQPSGGTFLPANPNDCRLSRLPAGALKSSLWQLSFVWPMGLLCRTSERFEGFTSQGTTGDTDRRRGGIGRSRDHGLTPCRRPILYWRSTAVCRFSKEQMNAMPEPRTCGGFGFDVALHQLRAGCLDSTNRVLMAAAVRIAVTMELH